MTKLTQPEEPELSLNDERLPKKLNRHVVIALNHMSIRRDSLIGKRSLLTKEIEELDSAIEALR